MSSRRLPVTILLLFLGTALSCGSLWCGCGGGALLGFATAFQAAAPLVLVPSARVVRPLGRRPSSSSSSSVARHVLPPSDSAFDEFLEGDSIEDEEEENAQGLDDARRFCERLLSRSTESAANDDEPYRDNDSGSFPLTSAALHRRHLEIQLLAHLEDCDDAVDELAHLWMYEVSAEHGMALQSMEESCSPGLVHELQILESMIQQHPHWVEPQIRLATLLFFKGRTSDSYRVALRAYQRKPYHFELVPLLVMLALRNQDLGLAVRWARRGLPPLSRPRHRIRWVHRAVQRAQADLKRDTAARRRRQKVTGSEGGTATSSAGGGGGGATAWQ